MIDLPVIQTHRLCKSYGRTDAVRDLSLSVGAGRMTGFLGRNGAGKSTTIKMLTGMIRPTSGEGSVLGERIGDSEENVQLRRRVAYVSEDKRLYGYMTVAQMIRFTSGFYSDWRPDTAEFLRCKYELPADRKVKALSKGMRTKLALLLAIARQPALLILDEPSEGLDPVGVEQLLESLVTQCGEGTAVFFSSHQIEEVERIADQVCIVEQGRLLKDVSLDDIRQCYRRIDLVFPTQPHERDFRLEGVESVQTSGHQMRILASGNVNEVIERGHAFHASEVDVAPVSLREMFLSTIQENSHALV
ncbi:MAG TPA: ABC transporter ATP-binding protein [Bryobacteraceae bacterium]|nr:ABC transporter ATP-binding protein [Bryobacteraceae bacterium]